MKKVSADFFCQIIMGSLLNSNVPERRSVRCPAATAPRLPLQYTAHAASHPGALPKQLHPSPLLHPLLVPTLALLHFPKEKQQSWHNFVAIEILT